MSDIIKSGTYVGRNRPDEPWTETEPSPGAAPDAVVCRRLVDYPGFQVPRGGEIGTCGRCDQLVVFNPKGPHQDRPRVCMQCVGISPLPFGEGAGSGGR